jgi:hypothetical protein
VYEEISIIVTFIIPTNGAEFLDKLMVAQLLIIFCDIQEYKVRLLFVPGRGTSVDIATRYGLDGPGIESR